MPKIAKSSALYPYGGSARIEDTPAVPEPSPNTAHQRVSGPRRLPCCLGRRSPPQS